MGQYFIAVNLNKAEFMEPTDFGSFIKLTEVAEGASPLMTTIGDLIRKDGPWFGDKLVLTGDYADNGKFLPASEKKMNLHSYSKSPGNLRALKIEGLPKKPLSALENGPDSETMAAVLGFIPLYHFANTKGKFQGLLSSSNWSNIEFSDLQDVLDLMECPASSSSELLSVYLRGCLQDSIYLCPSQTLKQFEKIIPYSTGIEDRTEEGKVKVNFLFKGDSLGTEITFPCTALSFFEQFGVTPEKYETLIAELK